MSRELTAKQRFSKTMGWKQQNQHDTAWRSSFAGNVKTLTAKTRILSTVKGVL
jgi:hypothetical protein